VPGRVDVDLLTSLTLRGQTTDSAGQKDAFYGDVVKMTSNSEFPYDITFNSPSIISLPSHAKLYHDLHSSSHAMAASY
jgi:hypothetical protein